MWRVKLSPALTSSIGRPRRSSFRSSSRSSRAQSRPTTRARMSRVDRLRRGEQHRLDPGLPFAPAQFRRQVGELAVEVGFGARTSAPCGSEPVEAEGRAAGELARGAERDQALEQAPAGAVA